MKKADQSAQAYGRERQRARAQTAAARPLATLYLVSGFLALIMIGSPSKAEDLPHPCIAEQAVTDAIPVKLDEHGNFRSADGQLHRPVGLQEIDVRQLEKTTLPAMHVLPAGKQDHWLTRPAWLVAYDAETRKPEIFQEHLLRSGVALMNPEGIEPACAHTLLKTEEDARRTRQGMWRRSQPMDSSSPKLLLKQVGHYVVISGHIVSLGKTRSTRYLNFGTNWKDDLTATISIKQDELFAQHLAQWDLSFEELTGRKVLLRGWIDQNDGPLIRLTEPLQLQLDQQ